MTPNKVRDTGYLKGVIEGQPDVMIPHILVQYRIDTHFGLPQRTTFGDMVGVLVTRIFFLALKIPFGCRGDVLGSASLCGVLGTADVLAAVVEEDKSSLTFFRGVGEVFVGTGGVESKMLLRLF